MLVFNNYLYYKEQRQLKTFPTQFGPTVPLTQDPPVICFWKWIGWKDYKVPKNRNLESVSAKNVILLSPTTCVPTLLYPPGPPGHPPVRSLPDKQSPSLFLNVLDSQSHSLPLLSPEWLRLMPLRRLSTPVPDVSANAGGAEPTRVGRETCTRSMWGGGHGRGGPAVEICVVKNGGAWGRAIQPWWATLPGARSCSAWPPRRAALPGQVSRRAAPATASAATSCSALAEAPHRARQVPSGFGAPTRRRVNART
jgi:hypothetical protein